MNIILGLRDYLKDIFHDWIYAKLIRLEKIHKLYYKKNNKMIAIYTWKEGSLCHYIQQRKIAKKIRKINKSLKDL